MRRLLLDLSTDSTFFSIFCLHVVLRRIYLFAHASYGSGGIVPSDQRWPKECAAGPGALRGGMERVATPRFCGGHGSRASLGDTHGGALLSFGVPCLSSHVPFRRWIMLDPATASEACMLLFAA